MGPNNYFKSPKVKQAAFVAGAMLFTLAIFQAGMYAGYRKAAFSFRMGENYYRLFGGEHGFGMAGPGRGGFSAAGGARGTIIRFDPPSLLIKEPENMEKMVLISDDTEIRRERARVATDTLYAGQRVIIIGTPNETGEIDARFIRIMPFAPVESDYAPDNSR